MASMKKVRNWKEYNRALVKRGEIIFTFDENYLDSLYYSGQQKRGGKKEYTEKMYEYLLTIKIMFRLPWRATVGFAYGLLTKAFPKHKIDIADYAHASREAGKLNLQIQSSAPISSGMELAFDSTGVNVYTTSGWHQRKHGKDSLHRKRDQWKKIHIAMDLNSMQIVSVAYTDSNVNDCEVVKEMCNEIKGVVRSVRADGAYDTEEFYRIISGWGARAMIPAARTSKAQDELKKKAKIKKAHLTQRDNMIREIRRYDNFDDGLKEWKVSSGYHRRSLIESCMFRLKRVFGFYLHQKTEAGRRNEIITKVNLLNLMASIGRAEYSS
jgi:transposase